MTKAQALEKIEELKKFIEAEDQASEYPWEPRLDESYWRVDGIGDVNVSENTGGSMNTWDILIGNYYRTEEEAKKASRRMVAMKPKYLPKMGDNFWVINTCSASDCNWDNDPYDLINYWSGNTFKTQQEAEAWWEEYKDAFEIRGGNEQIMARRV